MSISRLVPTLCTNYFRPFSRSFTKPAPSPICTLALHRLASSSLSTALPSSLAKGRSISFSDNPCFDLVDASFIPIFPEIPKKPPNSLFPKNKISFPPTSFSVVDMVVSTYHSSSIADPTIRNLPVEVDLQEKQIQEVLDALRYPISLHAFAIPEDPHDELSCKAGLDGSIWNHFLEILENHQKPNRTFLIEIHNIPRQHKPYLLRLLLQLHLKDKPYNLLLKEKDEEMIHVYRV